MMFFKSPKYGDLLNFRFVIFRWAHIGHANYNLDFTDIFYKLKLIIIKLVIILPFVF